MLSTPGFSQLPLGNRVSGLLILSINVTNNRIEDPTAHGAADEDALPLN
jgi:hypothetical protein